MLTDRLTSSRITILTGNHLCHNPRVVKEAGTLAKAGYRVTVIGAWLDRALKARDIEMQKSLAFTFTPAVDATKGRVGPLRVRVARKIGSVAHRLARFENRKQLGYALPALFRSASRQPADLYIAHSEPAMAVAVDLQREGRCVGVDMEDWFSADLCAEARRSRPVHLLRDLEHKLLISGLHCTCPSRAMSDALAIEFGCSRPAVVYNAFHWSDRPSIDGLFKDRRDRTLPSIHWFSQTLGPGRGLEDLIAALPLLKHKAEVHLRGHPARGFEDWIARRVPANWRERFVLHGTVSNEELLSRIAEHDIGFAGETPDIPSRNLTVTNKILHYLLAGLAVVASNTAGHREVAADARGSVFLYPAGDPAALAARLNTLLDSADVLRQAKAAALLAAEKTFCWERQEKALTDSVSRALLSVAA